MLRLPSLDIFSFWSGFIIASLLWLVVAGLRRLLRQLAENYKLRQQLKRESVRESLEQIFRQSTLNRAQRMHLGQCFFPLDSILIEPKVFVPFFELFNDSVPDYLLPEHIPYMPSFPRVTSTFGYPQQPLVNCLLNGANIVLVGKLGSGKTTALAALTAQIARSSTGSHLDELLPLFFHISDIDVFDESTPHLEKLIQALTSNASQKELLGFSEIITARLTNRIVLLLIDGLDELHPDQHQKAMKFLSAFLLEYPVQTIITADPCYLGQACELGFVPVLIAPWSSDDYTRFAEKWQSVSSSLYSQDPIEQPEILHSDLAKMSNCSTPFIATLQIMPTLFGFSQIIDETQLLSDYVNWVTDGKFTRDSLATFASPLFNSKVIAYDNPRHLSAAKSSKSNTPKASAKVEQSPPPSSPLSSAAIEFLLGKGVLSRSTSGKLLFSSTVLFAFVCDIPDVSFIDLVSPAKLQWSVYAESLRYHIANPDVAGIQQLITKSFDEPMFRPHQLLLRSCSLLPESHPLRNALMKLTVPLLLDETIPSAFRLGLIAAICESNEPGASTLFSRMLSSDSQTLARLGAVGCGLLHDAKSVSDLTALSRSANSSTAYAATLALAVIHTAPALKTLAEIFLSGNENHRRLVAELFASNIIPDGDEILKEGASLDDIVTRRAAVFGMMISSTDWSLETIKQIAVQDSQWLVRNAAGQALDARQNPNALIPVDLVSPWDASKVQEWSKKHGEVIELGQFPFEILQSMVDNGQWHEKRLALHYLACHATDGTYLALYNQTFGKIEPEELPTYAYYLWKLSASGMPVPPPSKYGFI